MFHTDRGGDGRRRRNCGQLSDDKPTYVTVLIEGLNVNCDALKQNGFLADLDCFAAKQLASVRFIIVIMFQ